MAAVLLLAPVCADAQSVVDPTTAEFDPSADHNATVSGAPVVDRYDIGFYLIAAAQPFQVNQLGKPSPDLDGKIRVGLGSRPAPALLYEARVSAVGPGGAGLSAVSNDFTFSAPLCSYTASPTTQTMAAGGAAGSVAVTTTSGCAWTATEGLTWVTIASGSSGTGTGTVSYTVSANTSTSSRTGTLTAAGQAVTITQEGQVPPLEAPSNLRIISRVEQGPSLEDPRGIGSAPATSEDNALVGNGRLAAAV